MVDPLDFGPDSLTRVSSTASLETFPVPTSYTNEGVCSGWESDSTPCELDKKADELGQKKFSCTDRDISIRSNSYFFFSQVVSDNTQDEKNYEVEVTYEDLIEWIIEEETRNESHNDLATLFTNDMQGIFDNIQSFLLEQETSEKSNNDSKTNSVEKKYLKDLSEKKREIDFFEKHASNYHLATLLSRSSKTSTQEKSANPPIESGSEPTGIGSREPYECSNRCQGGKKICRCISRPLALKMGLAKGELDDVLSWSLEQYIKPEIVAINKVWKKTKNMSSVKSKLKKIKRNENNQERPVCRENGKKHHKCYNCQKPTGDCNNSACSHCRCIKVSIQIPIGIWAYETMAWSQIKPDLLRRYNGDYQSKTKKE